MDINGVWASVNFPSMITGFCGRVFFNAKDRELGLACIARVERLAVRGVVQRAPRPHHPARHHVPRRSRARRPPRSAATPTRGFTGDQHARAPAPDRPARRSGTATTGTRSSRRASTPTPSSRCTSAARGWRDDARRRARRCSSAPRCSASCRSRACAEWLWSGYPVKHPTLKIAMSEGGIGWVAMLLDRLDNIIDRSGYGARVGRAPGRRAEAQLLVLHDRRPVDDRHPPPHRRREHHGRDRLPARRRHVARHAARDREVLGSHPRRRAAHDVQRERGRRSTATRCPRSCCPR